MMLLQGLTGDGTVAIACASSGAQASGPALSTKLTAAAFDMQSEQYHTSGSGSLRLTHGR